MIKHYVICGGHILRPRKLLASQKKRKMSDNKGFKVYKSSAGSGKTYTLVKEYLKIVLANPEKMQEVLAITFTNAAAAQMKGRIIKELCAMANLDVNLPIELDTQSLVGKIIVELEDQGCSGINLSTIKENACIVLEKILHGYSDFSVSTIDSFVHRVIRSFAFDLQVPVNFEIEPNATRLLSQAIDMVVGATGTNKPLTQFLISFVSRQADEGKNLGVEDMIGNLAGTLMAEDSEDYVDRLRALSLDDFIKIEKGLWAKVRAIEKEIQTKASDALSVISTAGISGDSFYQGKNGVHTYLSKFSKGDFSRLLPNSFVITTINEDKWVGGKASKEQAAAIESIVNVLSGRCKDLITLVEKTRNNYQLLKAVWRNIFPLGVLSEVSRVLDGIKRDNALLHFSDFNKKISKIVAEQPIPFIYERIGERFKHFMIDEFQDTSQMQWLNLLPLVENGLAGGNRSLIVGDGKQAIYRYRGGEVGQFVNLPDVPEEIKAEAKHQWQASLRRNFDPEVLDHNWRSRENIIEFNNRFFEFASQQLPEHLRNIYKESAQKVARIGSGGFVKVAFLEKKNLLAETLKRVKGIVDDLIKEGHTFGDIAILCRSNKNGSLIAKHLLANQIPVISSDSLLLNQSPEVIFIISMLKLVANKNDAIAACEAIDFLVQEKVFSGSRTLHEVLTKGDVFPVSSAKRNHNWQNLLGGLLQDQGISFDISEMKFLSAYDATQLIIRTFFSGKATSPFVNFFVDHILEYSEKGHTSISDFLGWWGESSGNLSVVTPDGVDAVRVMTIHKAKGLEFPVVIFPFAHASSTRPTKDGFWVEPIDVKEIEGLPAAYFKYSNELLEGTGLESHHSKEKDLTMFDNLNLFYVAMTRAEDKLYVLSKASIQEKTTSLQALLKEFLNGSPHFEENKGSAEYTLGKTWNEESNNNMVQEGKLVLEKLLSRGWSDALMVASKQEGRGGESYKRRELGRILHSAMEKVFVHEDLWPVLEGFIAQGLIEENIAIEWNANLGKILSDTEISECFSRQATIKTEPGMFDHKGNFLRPDRVALLDGKTVIIDYKTGQGYPQHKNQVDNYAQVLQAMGYPNVKKYLLYLEEPRLVAW